MSTYVTTPTGENNHKMSKLTASDKLVVIYKRTDKLSMPDHILFEKTKAKKEYLEVSNKDEMLIVIGSLLSGRTKFVILDSNISIPAGLMEKYDIGYADDSKATPKKATAKRAATKKKAEDSVESEEKETEKPKTKAKISTKSAKSNEKKLEMAEKEDEKPEEPLKEEKKPAKKAHKPRKKKEEQAAEEIQVSEKIEEELKNALNKPEESVEEDKLIKSAKKKNPFATSIKSSEDLFDHPDAITVSKRTGIRASDVKEKIDEEALMLLIADAVRENEKDEDLKFALKTRFDDNDFAVIWTGVRMGLSRLRKELT